MIYRVKKMGHGYEIWEMHSETAVDSSVRIKFTTKGEVVKFIEENLKDKRVIWDD